MAAAKLAELAEELIPPTLDPAVKAAALPSILAGLDNIAGSLMRIQAMIVGFVSDDYFSAFFNAGGFFGPLMWWYKGQRATDVFSKVNPLNIDGKAADPLPGFLGKLAPPGTTTALCDLAMVITQAMDFFNGFGTPDRGAAFGSASGSFDKADGNLWNAAPKPDQWDGPAAKAYADRDAELQVLVSAMRDLDSQMQAVVANQGEAVRNAHLRIAGIYNGLRISQAIALGMCVYYMPDPNIGYLKSVNFQAVAATVAVAAAVAVEIAVVNNAVTNRNEINRIRGEYAGVAAAADELLKRIPDKFVDVPVCFSEAGARTGDIPGWPVTDDPMHAVEVRVPPPCGLRASAPFAGPPGLAEPSPSRPQPSGTPRRKASTEAAATEHFGIWETAGAEAGPSRSGPVPVGVGAAEDSDLRVAGEAEQSFGDDVQLHL